MLRLRPAIISKFIDTSKIACPKELALISHSIKVIPDFISAQEGIELSKECERKLRRLCGREYNEGHFDAVIKGYKEASISSWKEAPPENLNSLFKRTKNEISSFSTLKSLSFLPPHILELRKIDSFIKAHVDHLEASGSILAGICLLSDAVMIFRNGEHEFSAFLPARCLYLQKDHRVATKIMKINIHANTATLVSQLKEIHNSLKDDQSEVISESLNTLKNSLTNHALLFHKDKGVKILVACCLADIMRIYCPNPPFEIDQLKDVIAFFIHQLHYIHDTKSPFFEYYFLLLENLAVVKSFTVIADFDQCDELVVELLQVFMLSLTPSTSKNIKLYMLEILNTVIQESPHLPSEVISMLMEQFTKKNIKNSPAAHQMAVDVCRQASDKLQRYVYQYFGEQIVNCTSNSEPSSPSSDADDFQSSNQELAAVHELILLVHASVPSVLLNVIPQLEEELKAANVDVRTLAVEVLAKMFCREGGARLAAMYPGVWKTWTERRNDNHLAIRVMWSELCFEFFQMQPELIPEISTLLAQKMMDPDEKVRIASVKVVGRFNLLCAQHVSKPLLTAVGDRCRDKKHHVREEAILALAKLFALVYDKLSTEDDPIFHDTFKWIPAHLIELVYVDDPEMPVIVEKVLHECIFPVEYDDEKRTRRLIFVYKTFHNADRTTKAFISILERQAQTQQHMGVFLNLCEKFNGGVMDDSSEKEKMEKILSEVVSRICFKYPDPKKSAANLLKFANDNQSRNYQLIKALCDTSLEYKKVLKNSKELFKRIEKLHIEETFSILLRRIALSIINKSMLPTLIKLIAESRKGENAAKQSKTFDAFDFEDDVKKESIVDDDSGRIAEILIKNISVVFPSMYRAHIDEFLGMLDGNDQLLVSDALYALSQFVKAFPEEPLDIKKHKKTLFKFATKGTPSQASNAMVIVACSDSTTSTELCFSVFKKIQGDITIANPAQLVTYLSSICQIAYYAPISFDHFPFIISFIFKNLLMTNDGVTAEDDESVDWVEHENLDDMGKAKILGLKILVKRLLAGLDTQERKRILLKDHKKDPDLGSQFPDSVERDLNQNTQLNTNSAQVPKFASVLFKLLKKIIENEGELVDDNSTLPLHKTHLRMRASISLLRLSRFSVYLKMISIVDLCKLALTMQDTVFQVRNNFFSKLCKYHQSKKLPFHFITMIMLAAHEPEDDLRKTAKSYISKKARDQKTFANTNQQVLVETMLPRLIHLLVHHPDFSNELEDLNMFSTYIEFFLDSVITSENASYLFHMVAKLKTMKDIHSEVSEPIYVLCDMTQLLIKERCSAHSWGLPSYPGHVGFPKDLFAKVSSKEGTANLKKSYLPDDFVNSRSSIQKVKITKSTPSKRKSGVRASSIGVDDLDETTDTVKKRRKSSIKKKKDEFDFSSSDEDVLDRPEATPTRRNASRSVKKISNVYDKCVAPAAENVDNKDSEGESDKMDIEQEDVSRDEKEKPCGVSVIIEVNDKRKKKAVVGRNVKKEIKGKEVDVPSSSPSSSMLTDDKKDSSISQESSKARRGKKGATQKTLFSYMSKVDKNQTTEVNPKKALSSRNEFDSQASLIPERPVRRRL